MIPDNVPTLSRKRKTSPAKKIHVLIWAESQEEINAYSCDLEKWFSVYGCISPNDISKKLNEFIPQVVVCVFSSSDSENFSRYAQLRGAVGNNTEIITIMTENTLQAEKEIRQIGTFFYLIAPIFVESLKEIIVSAADLASKHVSLFEMTGRQRRRHYA